MFNLYDLLWEEHVGKNVRAQDREAAALEAQRAAAYAKSAAYLRAQQQE